MKSYIILFYIFRYNAKAFGGLHRNDFVKALQEEGIPCSDGYVPLYREKFLEKTLKTRAFKKIFTSSRLDNYFSQIDCPVTERACNEEGVWIPQQVLLGTKKDMDNIIEAIRKIQKYGEELGEICNLARLA